MSKAMPQSYILIAILGVNALPILSAQSDKSITIHQEIEFNVSPKQLYEAQLDSKRSTEFSGRPAETNREVGGAFSRFKGHIDGRNLELVLNQRIVQAWRVVTWPEGAYSIVRFEPCHYPPGLDDPLIQNQFQVPNQRIVQAWRVVTWPEGAYSIVRFELKPQGSGTHLVFDHIGIRAFGP